MFWFWGLQKRGKRQTWAPDPDFGERSVIHDVVHAWVKCPNDILWVAPTPVQSQEEARFHLFCFAQTRAAMPTVHFLCTVSCKSHAELLAFVNNVYSRYHAWHPQQNSAALTLNLSFIACRSLSFSWKRNLVIWFFFFFFFFSWDHRPLTRTPLRLLVKINCFNSDLSAKGSTQKTAILGRAADSGGA